MPERIQKILSAHGVASRRKAESMILAGRITVGGIPARIGQSAEFGVDEIEVDGIPLAPRGKLVYIMLYKPRGYVTSMNDERGRKTVVSLVEDVGVRVYPVGRLDLDSEGLVLLTNDGLFAHAVMHPSFHRTKTYDVHVRGDADAAVPLLSRPMEIDSRLVRAVSVKLIKRTDDGGVLRVEVSEGRNRQIRKMCEQCGIAVVLLKRVAIGAVSIGFLKSGHWRHLTEEEVLELRADIG